MARSQSREREIPFAADLMLPDVLQRRFRMERTSSGLPHSSCGILILRVNDSFVKRGYLCSMGKTSTVSPMSTSIGLAPG